MLGLISNCLVESRARATGNVNLYSSVLEPDMIGKGDANERLGRWICESRMARYRYYHQVFMTQPAVTLKTARSETQNLTV